MARSSTKPAKLLLIGVLSILVIMAIGGVLFVFFKKPDPTAKLSPFPVNSYMDGNDLWSREDYRLEGKVENVLLRSDSGNSFLVSIRPDNSDFRLPVIVTREAGKLPVQREQQLVMQVFLDSSSEIRCKYYTQK